VLLDLQVEIGGRVLKGVVVEKKAAEEKYEDAVAAGDAAVMLQVIEPGLYTMNGINLLPQEKATITFSYPPRACAPPRAVMRGSPGDHISPAVQVAHRHGITRLDQTVRSASFRLD